MIEKLQIINHRCHKKLKIEFDKGVNCIIGSNAAGKSSILRALKWITKNSPGGYSMIKWGKDKTKVRLSFDTFHITRTKSKTENTYQLNKKEFKAFGNDVPLEIQSKLNINDLHFQGQHEAPFWFRETPGEVSRQLNRIINLEQIDNSLSFINKENRAAKTNYETTKKEVSEAQNTVNELKYVETMEFELRALESLEKELNGKRSKSLSIEDLIKDISNLKSKQGRLTESLSDANTAIKTGNILTSLIDKAKILKNTIETVRKLRKIKEKTVGNTNNLILLADEIKKHNKKHNELAEILLLLSKLNNKKEIQSKKIKEYNQELKKLSKGRCPLCQNPIK